MTEMTYFDTVLFIYALEHDQKPVCDLFRNAVSIGRVGVSAVTVMEYAVGCLKQGRRYMVDRFLTFLDDLQFEVQKIDEEVALKAAEIRAEYPSFKQMDALQLASAAVAGASVFYTNDRRLRQYRDDGLEVLLLDDLIK